MAPANLTHLRKGLRSTTSPNKTSPSPAKLANPQPTVRGSPRHLSGSPVAKEGIPGSSPRKDLVSNAKASFLCVKSAVSEELESYEELEAALQYYGEEAI